MMVRGLFWLVLLQLFGVALNHWLLPMLPASIIGLLLLSDRKSTRLNSSH